MISLNEFYSSLIKNDIDFFTGVPDSYLRDICAYIADHSSSQKHIITANEGSAIALATGHYLATRKIPLVYMQNSGLGNAVNPLTSLTDRAVYSIPLILLIGWRGEPGTKDEPQHIKQGRITTKLLDVLEIPYLILSASTSDVQQAIDKVSSHARERRFPYALLVRKDTFEQYAKDKEYRAESLPTREEALEAVLSNLNERDVVVATTGKLSRELFEYRERMRQLHSLDFLTVGSMGHASSIALGIALEKPERNVYCLDGDGALLMHLGAIATIGQHAPKNLRHIVFNNCAHDSVGGQPTAGNSACFPYIAKACKYTLAVRVESIKDIKDKMGVLKINEGPSFLEILIQCGARSDLGRPTISPRDNKEAFMKYLESES